MGFSLGIPQKWGFGWDGATQRGSSDTKTVTLTLIKIQNLKQLDWVLFPNNPGGCIPSL